MQALTADQKQTGQDNYYEAVGVTRRDFIKGVAAAEPFLVLVWGNVLWVWYGQRSRSRRGHWGWRRRQCALGWLHARLCGSRCSCGHTSQQYSPCISWRNWSSDAALSARPGLIKQYGYSSEAERKKHVTVYTPENGGMQALLDDPKVEAIIIALPLFLHAPSPYKP